MKWVAVIIQASRAACEWSKGVGKNRLKHEVGLRPMWAVRNERTTQDRLPAGGYKTIPVAASRDPQVSQARAAVGF